MPWHYQIGKRNLYFMKNSPLFPDTLRLYYSVFFNTFPVIIDQFKNNILLSRSGEAFVPFLVQIASDLNGEKSVAVVEFLGRLLEHAVAIGVPVDHLSYPLLFFNPVSRDPQLDGA